MRPIARGRGYGMQLLISQFCGVLHKPRIDIIPDPFLPGESGLATQDYVRTHLSSGPNFRQPPPTCTYVRAATIGMDREKLSVCEYEYKKYTENVHMGNCMQVQIPI